MKTRLNLTIEVEVLQRAKAHANLHHRSLSELVEGYLYELTKPKAKVTVIEMVENLKAPAFDKEADLKVLYYIENGEK